MQSPIQLLILESLSRLTKQVQVLAVNVKYISGLDRNVRQFHTATKIVSWDGMMAPTTRSLNGYRVDLLKSWLQKSIRRGNVADAIYSAYELDTLNRPARTNMWNRIIKIAVEDIGIANRDALEFVNKQHEIWLNYADSDLTRDPRGQAALARAVTYLCQSSKIRLVSDIKATYSDHYPEIVAQYPLLYLNITADFQESKVFQLNAFVSANADWTPDGYILPGDPVELPRLVKNFLGYLRTGSDRAFYWAYQILRLDKCAKRDRRGSPANVLWNIISRLCGADYQKYIATLYAAYKSQTTETTMFLIQAILLFMRPSKSIAAWKEVDYARCWTYNVIDVAKRVPDYAIDMHTKAGRKDGADQVQFASSGAEVSDEWKELVNPEMRRIYISTKNLQVYGTLTQEYVQVAQLATSAHKKLVRLYPNKVTKGPYESIDRLRILADKLKRLKSPVVDMKFTNSLGDWYIEMPQLATRSDWKVGEPVKSLAGPKFVRVVERDSMGISLARTAVLNDELWFWIFVHLIHRLVLGIGDSHLNNIIIVGGKVYGTDLDEVRPSISVPDNLVELETSIWSMKPLRAVRAAGLQALLRLRDRIKKYLTDADYHGTETEDAMLAACIKCLNKLTC